LLGDGDWWLGPPPLTRRIARRTVHHGFGEQIFGVNEQISGPGQRICPENAQRYSIKAMLAVFWLLWSVERGDNREIEAAFRFAGRSVY
jgi:hypothetical protein